MHDNYGNLEDIKIFHNGTPASTFVFDKYNKPVGGIVDLNINFNADQQEIIVTFKVPKFDLNGQVEFNQDSDVLLREIKVSGCKVHLYDHRLSNDEIINTLNLYDRFKKENINSIDFTDIENAFKESTR